MKLTEEEEKMLKDNTNWDLVAFWVGLIGGFGLLAFGAIVTLCK